MYTPLNIKVCPLIQGDLITSFDAHNILGFIVHGSITGRTYAYKIPHIQHVLQATQPRPYYRDYYSKKICKSTSPIDALSIIRPIKSYDTSIQQDIPHHLPTVRTGSVSTPILSSNQTLLKQHDDNNDNDDDDDEENKKGSNTNTKDNKKSTNNNNNNNNGKSKHHHEHDKMRQYNIPSYRCAEVTVPIGYPSLLSDNHHSLISPPPSSILPITTTHSPSSPSSSSSHHHNTTNIKPIIYPTIQSDTISVRDSSLLSFPIRIDCDMLYYTDPVPSNTNYDHDNDILDDASSSTTPSSISSSSQLQEHPPRFITIDSYTEPIQYTAKILTEMGTEPCKGIFIVPYAAVSSLYSSSHISNPGSILIALGDQQIKQYTHLREPQPNTVRYQRPQHDLLCYGTYVLPSNHRFYLIFNQSGTPSATTRSLLLDLLHKKQSNLNKLNVYEHEQPISVINRNAWSNHSWESSSPQMILSVREYNNLHDSEYTTAIHLHNLDTQKHISSLYYSLDKRPAGFVQSGNRLVTVVNANWIQISNSIPTDLYTLMRDTYMFKIKKDDNYIPEHPDDIYWKYDITNKDTIIDILNNNNSNNNLSLYAQCTDNMINNSILESIEMTIKVRCTQLLYDYYDLNTWISWCNNNINKHNIPYDTTIMPYIFQLNEELSKMISSPSSSSSPLSATTTAKRDNNDIQQHDTPEHKQHDKQERPFPFQYFPLKSNLDSHQSSSLSLPSWLSLPLSSLNLPFPPSILSSASPQDKHDIILKYTNIEPDVVSSSSSSPSPVVSPLSDSNDKHSTSTTTGRHSDTTTEDHSHHTSSSSSPSSSSSKLYTLYQSYMSTLTTSGKLRHYAIIDILSHTPYLLDIYWKQLIEVISSSKLIPSSSSHIIFPLFLETINGNPVLEVSTSLSTSQHLTNDHYSPSSPSSPTSDQPTTTASEDFQASSLPSSHTTTTTTTTSPFPPIILDSDIYNTISYLDTSGRTTIPNRWSPIGFSLHVTPGNASSINREYILRSKQQQCVRFKAHKEGVILAFSAEYDGTLVITLGSDRKIKVWYKGILLCKYVHIQGNITSTPAIILKRIGRVIYYICSDAIYSVILPFDPVVDIQYTIQEYISTNRLILSQRLKYIIENDLHNAYQNTNNTANTATMPTSNNTNNTNNHIKHFSMPIWPHGVVDPDTQNKANTHTPTTTTTTGSNNILSDRSRSSSSLLSSSSSSLGFPSALPASTGSSKYYTLSQYVQLQRIIPYSSILPLYNTQ